MNIGVISLGCAKNQVDLEEILSYLKRKLPRQHLSQHI